MTDIDTLLWPTPPMTIETMSEFMQKLPIKYKQNIWQRHSSDGYIATYNIIQTLHSFAALCIKLIDRSAIPPSKNDIEDKLQPLNSIIQQNISNNKNGMNEQEFNDKLHEWILQQPDINVSQSQTSQSMKTLHDHTHNYKTAPKMHGLTISKSYDTNIVDICVVSPIIIDEQKQTHVIPLKTSENVEIKPENTSLQISKSFDIKSMKKKEKAKRKKQKKQQKETEQQTTVLKKSKTFDENVHDHEMKQDKEIKKAYGCDDLMLPNKKKKSKKNKLTHRKRGRKGGFVKTNEFFCQVNVGQTVKLSKSRIAFVRYKGRVKFGMGHWYGVEIYDSFTKTRHNGTVFGKKYFNCPRHKGLFVKRDIILSIVKPENIKKVLKDLEKKQIKKQQQLEKEKAKKQREETNKDEKSDNFLAVYQNEIYGNNQLLLQAKNEKENDEEQIKKNFKRYHRLSSTAKDPKILSVINKVQNHNYVDEIKEDDEQDSETDDDFFKEKKSIFAIIENNDDENEYKITIFCELRKYILEYENRFNQGLYIKKVNNDSNEGRALILEFGVQAHKRWYITSINDENIKKMSMDAIRKVIENLNCEKGYNVVFKQHQ